MSDGVISIDVELNEKEFHASLSNMGEIVRSGSADMIGSIDNLGKNFKLLPDNIDTAFKSVPFLVAGLINNIASKNPVMAETGNKLFNSLVDNLPEVAENISGRLPEINDSIIDKIISFYPDIANTGRGFFGSLTDELPDAIFDIVEEVPGIALEISEKIDEGGEVMADSGFDLFASLIDNLPDAVKLISQAPHEIVDTVADGFRGLLFKFNDIGMNMVQGVWSGISSMASWLGSQVKNFFQGIVGGITDFLGIRSPSILFKDRIGRNIALGIGEGIAEVMPGVANDMLGYVNAVVDSAERGAGRINISRIAESALGHSYSNGANKNRDFKADMEHISDTPAVNITLEPSGDMRGFFEYISMNIKRVDYLGGGANI